jgi:hypothetical protein
LLKREALNVSDGMVRELPAEQMRPLMNKAEAGTLQRFPISTVRQSLQNTLQSRVNSERIS